MKWFKHMSDMSSDVRVKRLIRKYGVAGYGLYNYIIERIVARLETESPYPDLEEGSEDIAADLNMDTLKVEEIMLFCIQSGLFDQDEVTGRIVASKVYKFLAQSETRSDEIRAMIAAYKNGATKGNEAASQLSQTVTDKSEEQNRREENRREEEHKTVSDTHYEIDGDKLPINTTRYNRLVEEYGEKVTHDYIERAYHYSLKKRGDAKQYRDYTAAAEDYMRRDKVPKRQRESKSKIDARSLAGAPRYD